MTYDEMIAVLEAAKAGKVIEVDINGEWVKTDRSLFNFQTYEYRVKPEPKRCWVKFVEDGRILAYSEQPYEGYTEMVEVTK